MSEDYVEQLQTRMREGGFTIPAKDLSDPLTCKGILEAYAAESKGVSVAFIDWYCLDNEQLITVGEDLQNQLLKARQEIADLRDELAKDI